MATGNASEAYRRSYNAQNMKPASIHRMAKDLVDNLKIAARLAQLHAIHLKNHEITVAGLTDELVTDRAHARKLDQPSTAITATMGVAKLHGLLIERHEIKAHISTDESLLRDALAELDAMNVPISGLNEDLSTVQER